jgi:hypothetical protein
VSAAPAAHELCLLFERSLRGLGEEYRVQAAIEALLKREGVEHLREVTLSPKDRIDFLVGAVGIEVKVAGGVGAVIRQLERYAKHERISALVLVTTKSTLARVPLELNGKPLRAAVILPGIV